jgi:hypothetical protein
MPKTVTLNFLKKHDACSDAVAWIKTQKKKDHKSLFRALIAEKKDLSWGIWYLTQRFNKTQNIKLAIYAASQVLHIYEDRHPDDKRPRKAIQAARRYLNNPNSENRKAANAAAKAADAAANAAAYAAADAAYAAYAAANAAYAADAADAAADAKKELLIKILKYGIKLLERN